MDRHLHLSAYACHIAGFKNIAGFKYLNGGFSNTTLDFHLDIAMRKNAHIFRLLIFRLGDYRARFIVLNINQSINQLIIPTSVLLNSSGTVDEFSVSITKDILFSFLLLNIFCMVTGNRIVMPCFRSRRSGKACGRGEKNCVCGEYQTHYDSRGYWQILHDVLLV